jgi:hypothetical protein
MFGLDCGCGGVVGRRMWMRQERSEGRLRREGYHAISYAM